MNRMQLDGGSTSEYVDHHVRSGAIELWAVLGMIVAVLAVVSCVAKASFINQRIEAIRMIGYAELAELQDRDKVRLQATTDLLISKDDFEYAAFMDPQGQLLARSVRDNVAAPSPVLALEPTRGGNVLTGKWLFTVPIYRDLGYKKDLTGYVACQVSSINFLLFTVALVGVISIMAVFFSLQLRQIAARIGRTQRERWDSVSAILESNLNGVQRQIPFSDNDPAELAKLKAFCNEYIRRIHGQG